MPGYKYIHDLATEADMPKDGVLRRPLSADEHIKAPVFVFAAGQELSVHTAPLAASIDIVCGEARLALGSRPGAYGGKNRELRDLYAALLTLLYPPRLKRIGAVRGRSVRC